MKIRKKPYTDPRTMHDFSVGCGERLVAAGLLPTLHDAATCAGRQLDLLTPFVMGQRTHGNPVAGLVARVARRNVLIVIADGGRVAVQPMQPKPAVSVLDMINDARANMTARYGAFRNEWIFAALGTALQEFGHPPADEPPPATEWALQSSRGPPCRPGIAGGWHRRSTA